MLEIFLEYGLFLLKVITVLISVIVLISFIAASKKSNTSEGLEIENLNERYKGLSDSLNKAVMEKDEWKKKQKSEKAIAKKNKKKDIVVIGEKDKYEPLSRAVFYKKMKKK